MTANRENTQSRQARSHPDRLGRYRGTVKKSRRGAASRLASDKDPIAQAKTSTPIAPHVTAFFGQRLPIERHASENTRDSYAYAFRLLLAFASKLQAQEIFPASLSPGICGIGTLHRSTSRDP
jgi:hypothetical protein